MNTPERVIDNIIQPYGRGYSDALYDVFIKVLEMKKPTTQYRESDAEI